MTKTHPRKARPWTRPVVGVRRRKQIVGFWHVGAVGDWRRIMGEQYDKLKVSGLYDASEKIFVGFVGGRGREGELDVPILGDRRFELFTTEAVEDYEFPTLARVWSEAQNRQAPFLAYYFHTKGASLKGTPRQAAANAWRHYMEYFNLERWEDCAATLEQYETCGVELQSNDTHYSGNFWWATSDYIRRLPNAYEYWESNRANRMAAEFYLCLAHPRAHCFRDFLEDLYGYEIPPEAYRR